MASAAADAGRMADTTFSREIPADRPAMAAGLMLGSLLLISLQDAIVRLVGGETSLWQFQFLRATINIGLLLVLARILWGTGPRRPERMWAVALRSVLLIGAMLCFFGGVPTLTLTQMAAGLYTFPLFVTVLSVLVLGERVGPWRVAAVLAGAVGAFLILQPHGESFVPLQLLPVGAGLCYAGMIITTRRLCRTESPVTLAFGVAIAFLTVSTGGIALLALFPPDAQTQAAIPYLAVGWPELSITVLGAAMICSVLNIAANLGLSRAYQSAESSWLAPFDYSYLIFATFWGYVVFADFPDTGMLAGMALIASSGAVIALRERARSRRANGVGPARR